MYRFYIPFIPHRSVKYAKKIQNVGVKNECHTFQLNTNAHLLSPGVPDSAATAECVCVFGLSAWHTTLMTSTVGVVMLPATGPWEVSDR